MRGRDGGTRPSASGGYRSSGPTRVVGRPISVPASQAVIRPCWRHSRLNRITRPSARDRLDRIRPASRSRWSCRVVAGRLKPMTSARSDGRRGCRARAAMIRRRTGSASSSIPAPFRLGTSLTVWIITGTAWRAINRRLRRNLGSPCPGPRGSFVWLERPAKVHAGRRCRRATGTHGTRGPGPG